MAGKAKARRDGGDGAAAGPFAAAYPHIAAWVMDGWIEMGRDDFSHSFVRALDIGGMIWEGDDDYATVDAALLALDAGIAAFLEEHG